MMAREFAPEAAEDKAPRKLDLSPSVMAIDGTREIASCAQVTTWIPYNRVNDMSTDMTCSNLDSGRAPAREPIRILVRLAARGNITLSITERYCFPPIDVATSKMSFKNVKIDLHASLCCMVMPVIAQSTNEGNIVEGTNKWGQYLMHLDANRKQSSAMSGLDVKS
jgi:hypothetical protein